MCKWLVVCVLVLLVLVSAVGISNLTAAASTGLPMPQLPNGVAASTGLPMPQLPNGVAASTGLPMPQLPDGR